MSIGELTGVCNKHPFERAEHVCRGCGLEFCSDDVVYPFGAKKPPYCVNCAIRASGVRSTAAAQPMSKRVVRRRTKEMKRRRRDAPEQSGYDPRLPPIHDPDDADGPAPLALSAGDDRRQAEPTRDGDPAELIENFGPEDRDDDPGSSRRGLRGLLRRRSSETDDAGDTLDDEPLHPFLADDSSAEDGPDFDEPRHPFLADDSPTQDRPDFDEHADQSYGSQVTRNGEASGLESDHSDEDSIDSILAQLGHHDDTSRDNARIGLDSELASLRSTSSKTPSAAPWDTPAENGSTAPDFSEIPLGLSGMERDLPVAPPPAPAPVAKPVLPTVVLSATPTPNRSATGSAAADAGEADDQPLRPMVLRRQPATDERAAIEPDPEPQQSKVAASIWDSLPYAADD